MGSPGFATDVPEAAPVPEPLRYLRDPAAIYAASFAAIRAEADLSRVPEEARDLAIRLVHACGMPDLLGDLEVSTGAVEAGRAALAAGRPILCDAEMVVHGIIRRHLSAGNAILCRLNDPAVAPLAARLETTRSAAQVDLWDDALEGAVVAIGNAPTALFRLLERLDRGAPRPAVILGLPVGFVGAAESKAELSRHSRGIPFVTVHGRRGGSALASAAVNALAAGLAGGIA
ncbi:MULTISPECIES: precorrin-8X methylmutase [unclassified Aureimonas]|uniref:precorrin-8X methylmutase n=1 Tax=unclassified Aureimonas TaxID=2615206 RepID=UPI00237993CF|nr:MULTISPECIES: precorrin-8X methylmutase [unclassified Aureimonas]